MPPGMPKPSLTAGARLGPYEIVAAIGAGGMGEVYRARDTRLGRDVALKVLREEFARDAERMARFEREAHVLASLNHPNIAVLYGLEESGGVRALVMELVEGPTLAESIAGSALPPDEALGAARQIAEALEYAHDHGIVHRDLKPANVKVTPEGAVKVLDFGLAKALAGEPVRGGDNSPTLSLAATRAGWILGTAAYMSPEQARGKPADRRADIWSFGVVLYEMLAGERLYFGESAAEILASVMKDEPAIHRLPAGTPAAVVALVRRCLQKDTRRRLQAIGEARIVLEEVLSGSAIEPAVNASAGQSRRAAVAGLAALSVALAGLAGWLSIRAPRATSQPVNRWSTILENFTPVSSIALSPDGSRLTYVGGSSQSSQLWVRSLDQPDAKPIPGADEARHPFFSPDGQWIGYFAGGKLRKVRSTGGASATLCDAEGSGGASWSSDDTIIFETGRSLSRVSAAGGAPQRLAQPDADRGEAALLWPSVLPGGEALLCTISGGASEDRARVAAIHLRTGERRTLVERASSGRYVPTGHLVFAREGALFGIRFHPARLEVAGKASPVLEGLEHESPGVAFFSFSDLGTLAYLPGGTGSARNLV